MKQLLLLIFILSAATAKAQSINPITKAFSAGFDLGIPQNSVYTIGLGLSAKGELPVSSKLALTVTAGYDLFFYKSNLFGTSATPTAAQFVPLKAGAKYYFTGEAYLEGELGTSVETNYLKQNVFAFSLGPGFVLPSGDHHAIDLGFRYEQWADHQVRQTAISVGYRF